MNNINIKVENTKTGKIDYGVYNVDKSWKGTLGLFGIILNKIANVYGWVQKVNPDQSEEQTTD
jgi:hypothetical protein